MSTAESERRFEDAVNRGALHLARWVPTLVVVASGALVGLTLLGPLLHDLSPGISGGIHTAFGLSCHQIPDRCLRIGPGLAPVCARCQAIYVGLFGAGVAALALKMRRRISWLTLGLLALPMAVDGLSQMFLLRESNTALRLLTGALWGIGLGLFTVPLLTDAFIDLVEELRATQERKQRRRAVEAGGDPASQNV